MAHEDLPPDNEQLIDVNRPIEELLPRYYEAYGDNQQYEIVQLFEIEGHQVAWLRYTGKIIYDIMGLGREGTPYEGYTLECACHFTEGVGWEEDERGVSSLGVRDGCDKFEEVVRQRQLALRQEYQERGVFDDDTKGDPAAIKAVILDLIDKRNNNVFLEGSNGAEFWGGYYYLQTVQSIMDNSWEDIWKAVHELQRDKFIRLEGMVVQTYHEPYTAQTYEPGAAPEAVIYQEKPEKVWALVPRPEEQELDLHSSVIDDASHWSILSRCVVGLAHTPELAQARLVEAVANPRVSNERLYQRSFVEASYHAGALAVIAYTARTSDQPEEWVVEGFLGDAVVPEVRTLPMDYPTMFGIDAADIANLDTMIDEWYPPQK